MTIKEKKLEEFKGQTFSSNYDVLKWLSETIDEVREDTVKKLMPYLSHDSQCITQFEEDENCNCGLTDILVNIYKFKK